MRIKEEMIQSKIEYIQNNLNVNIHKKENLLIFNNNIILEFKNKTEVINFLYNIIKLYKNNIVDGVKWILIII